MRRCRAYANYYIPAPAPRSRPRVGDPRREIHTRSEPHALASAVYGRQRPARAAAGATAAGAAGGGAAAAAAAARARRRRVRARV